MTRPALVTMPVSKLIEDLSIYPRRIVNQNHVRDLTSALQAAEGADIFPPLTVDRRSKRIVDGFHRRRAFLAVLGPDAEIQAELRTYHSETELLLDAVRLNCVHGLNLYEIEKRRIVLKLSDLGVDDDEIAGALHVPPVRGRWPPCLITTWKGMRRKVLPRRCNRRGRQWCGSVRWRKAVAVRWGTARLGMDSYGMAGSVL